MKTPRIGVTVSAGLLSAAFLFHHSADASEIFTLTSGVGMTGTDDAAITFLLGPADTFFGSVLDAADFAAARSGDNAAIIERHAAWIDPTMVSPIANWISTNPVGATEGSTALFAMDFFITDTVINSATINVDRAVDNFLGDPVGNQGIFINGTALSGNTTAGDFLGVTNVFRDDIGPLLKPGLNTLFFNMHDAGGPSGLVFEATIETVGSQAVSVPEPGTRTLVLVGIAGIALLGLRKLRRGTMAD